MAQNSDKSLPQRIYYNPRVALAICEEIASGKTLVEITDTEGFPSRNAVYRWLTLYPKFFEAYERAKEVSAQSFEDEALAMARILKGQNDFTGTKVQAYNIAMQQLRWSAARRDPKRYGAQSQTAGIAVAAKIEINTTLNLGQDGAAIDSKTSVYTVEVDMQRQVDELDGPARAASGLEAEVIDLEDGDYVEMPSEDEPEGEAFGVPTERQDKALVDYKPRGRPRGPANKRHKSPGAAARTARIYAEKEIKKNSKKSDT